MKDTAESLLREHLKLCDEAHGRGLVPTREAYWADAGDYIMLAGRWYNESSLRQRTVAFLSGVTVSPQKLVGEPK